MIRRYREILSLILNAKGFITGSELAKFCNVSLRTIQLDMKEINKQLKDYNIKIESVVKKGYCLNDISKKIIKENDIIRSVMDFKYIDEMPSTPDERIMYILLQLTNREYIPVEELSENMYISASTLNSDILAAKKWLKENLRIESGISYSLIKGVKLNVKEKEKRNIISWFFGKKSNASSLSKCSKYLFGDEDIHRYSEQLFYLIDEETKKYGYVLSGHSSQLICKITYILYRRVQDGYGIESDYVENQQQLPVLEAFKEKVEAKFNWILSKREWLNIQEYFESSQFINGTKIEHIVTEETVNMFQEFSRVIYEKYSINLQDNEEVSRDLLLYFSPMIKRLKSNHCIPNTIDENITEVYPMEFKMASEISSIVNDKFMLDVSPIEIAYITMHLVSNEIWCNKLNVIIVCDLDESIISFVKNKILKHMGERIIIKGIYTYQQFIYKVQGENKNIDLVITTSNLADKTNIRSIQINPSMKQKEIYALCDYLDKF